MANEWAIIVHKIAWKLATTKANAIWRRQQEAKLGLRRRRRKRRMGKCQKWWRRRGMGRKWLLFCWILPNLVANKFPHSHPAVAVVAAAAVSSVNANAVDVKKGGRGGGGRGCGHLEGSIIYSIYKIIHQ
jgi:hypothetical protein